MYSVLEQKLAPILDKENIGDIHRAGRILEDMMELNQLHGFVYSADQYACEVSKDYVKYISEKEPEELIPHLYVRHFGDMYGGAMIAKKIPGSGKMYEFDNKEEMKEKVRSMLNDDMADEANKCFEYAIRLFEELMDE
jgi:heme oxygenase